MCGFAGFLSLNDIGGSDEAAKLLRQMGARIVHRGPDSEGVWSDRAAGIGLVHRRLSILDLSAAGHQPMISADNRYVLAFNGEIYNHVRIRAELDATGYGSAWRGHSDTETLLAAFLAWGVEAALQRCVGMFAIALWDKKNRILTLARDRVGEKPLYYGWQGQGSKKIFLFGSELKALTSHPGFSSRVSRGSLALFMRHNYVPAPYSIYDDIFKLEPGCILTVSVADTACRVSKYWDFQSVAKAGQSEFLNLTNDEIVNELESLAIASVRDQMVADVSLGAFLSGGIDSSTVVALMQSQSTRPVKTFTIGFNEEGYNEAVHAKAVAHHLGTEHTELYVTPGEAINVIPNLPSLYDEPFADSSQIPTFLVSSLARKYVTVSLSGDGGDELFGGYSRYLQANRMWTMLNRAPCTFRRGAARTIKSISVESWDRIAGPLMPFLPPRIRKVGDRAHKFAELLHIEDAILFYRNLVSHWSEPESLVIGGFEHSNYFTQSHDSSFVLGSIESMMLADSVTYLPDDVLVKVDRAAMGVSLETRVPFLDHRLIEFAWKIPLSLKIKQGRGKWALRQVLYRYVPRELVERPKMGFGVPIGNWLRGPLRPWAESLLDEQRLKQEGFLCSNLVRRKWNEHLSGHRNWQYQLWNVLMFQAWSEGQ